MEKKVCLNLATGDKLHNFCQCDWHVTKLLADQVIIIIVMLPCTDVQRLTAVASYLSIKHVKQLLFFVFTSQQHKILNQCCFNVGPTVYDTRPTLKQHCSTSCVAGIAVWLISFHRRCFAPPGECEIYCMLTRLNGRCLSALLISE